MEFSEFVRLPDLERVFLIEIRVGKEVETEGWTQVGSSNAYYCSFDDGEVVAVVENGTSYTKKSSSSEVESTASSFYWDFKTKRLYVQTSGSDAPDTQVDGEYKYTIIAYFWLCFTNSQFENDRIVYVPQDATYPVYYLPYFDVSSFPSVSQAVADYYIGAITLSYGNLRFLNDGWWYDVLRNYLWHNKDIEMKVGRKGSDYSDFAVVASGKVRNPSVADDYAFIEIRDRRIVELREIPIYRFWTSQYPNLEKGAEGRVIPIPFGELEGITPVCIDTVNFKYKVSYYEIEAITAVYKDGVQLTEGTDYTVDLANGEFTLTSDPGDAVVTCDVKGVKCDYNDGTYSENVADILYFVLNTLNGISASKIDQASFDDLKSARTQRMAWYLDEAVPSIEFIRLLQRSAVFHLIPTLDGKYVAKRYTTGTDSSTPKLYEEDYDEGFRLNYETDSVFKRVVVKYKKNHSTGDWLKVKAEEEKVYYRIGEEDTLTVQTALIDKTEAQSLAEFYLSLVKAAAKKVSGDIPAVGLNLNPADKIIVTKKVTSAEGEEISVFEEEVYRVLKLNKSFNPARVYVEALEDIQSTGGYHANVAHTNTHEDSHSDSPYNDTAHENIAHENVSHEDVAHEDTAHTDTAHENTAHENIAHENVSHEDTPHSDVAHSDSHSDTAHSNVAHENVAHSDVAHEDTPHSDVAHDDVSHADSHSDTAHSDSHSDAAHENVAHENVPHSDDFHHKDHFDDPLYEDEPGHIDNPHENVAHEDTPHSDSHSDVAHSDSHADTAHQDTAHENVAHSDVAHENVAHEDVAHSDVAHSDSHENTAHENIAHENVAHSNTVHSDTPHGDSDHGDLGHSNVAHENVAHENVAHSDVAHENTAHEDSHSDAHLDSPHSNSTY